jgi:hypothetical protein
MGENWKELSIDNEERCKLSPRALGNFRLHPLMHTRLVFTPAQDVWFIQRSAGFGRELPQTGHTFSVGLTIRLALHLGHLAGCTLTRLIS